MLALRPAFAAHTCVLARAWIHLCSSALVSTAVHDTAAQLLQLSTHLSGDPASHLAREHGAHVQGGPVQEAGLALLALLCQALVCMQQCSEVGADRLVAAARAPYVRALSIALCVHSSVKLLRQPLQAARQGLTSYSLCPPEPRSSPMSTRLLTVAALASLSWCRLCESQVSGTTCQVNTLSAVS